MPRFEYEVISLDRNQSKDLAFHWRCHCAGTKAEHGEISHLLNRFGREGWSVVAHTADARFGTSIVLQREIGGSSEDGGGGASPDFRTASPPLGGGKAQAALLAEVRALREATQRPGLTADAVAQAVREALAPVAEHLQQAIGAPPPPVIAQLDEEDRAALRRALQPAAPQLPPVDYVSQRTLDEWQQSLRESIVASVAALPPAQAVLAPAAVECLEAALARATDRSEPPAGPTTALLDPTALARLEAIVERAAAERPAVTVHARATLDEDGRAALQSAFDAAVRGLPTPLAALDRGSLAQLGEVVRAAITDVVAGPTTATLAPEVAAQLCEAVAGLPAPTVQAAATPELRAELARAVERAVTRALAAVPAPATSATLDAAAVERLEAVVAQASRPAVTTELELLVRRLVAEALPPPAPAPTPLPLVVEPIEVASPAEVELPARRVERRSWWPRLSERLRWAPSR